MPLLFQTINFDPNAKVKSPQPDKQAVPKEFEAMVNAANKLLDPVKKTEPFQQPAFRIQSATFKDEDGSITSLSLAFYKTVRGGSNDGRSSMTAMVNIANPTEATDVRYSVKEDQATDTVQIKLDYSLPEKGERRTRSYLIAADRASGEVTVKWLGSGSDPSVLSKIPAKVWKPDGPYVKGTINSYIL